MDAERFDGLLRSLSETPSRRGVSRALSGLALGGALGLLGRADAEAGKKGKKGKKKGKKKSPPVVPPPPPPPCLGQPNDTPCEGDGKCFQGGCVGRPTCTGFNTSCQPGNTGSPVCCSGYCANTSSAPGFCTRGNGGRACYETADCQTGYSCVGYRCLTNFAN